MSHLPSVALGSATTQAHSLLRKRRTAKVDHAQRAHDSSSNEEKYSTHQIPQTLASVPTTGCHVTQFRKVSTVQSAINRTLAGLKFDGNRVSQTLKVLKDPIKREKTTSLKNVHCNLSGDSCADSLFFSDSAKPAIERSPQRPRSS